MTIKITSLALLLLSLGVIQAQNVGVGTPNPQEKLHVAGTFRADALSSAAAAVAGSKVVYVDTNGKFYALPSGSPGMILGLDASGIPLWINPTTPSTLNSGQVWIGDASNVPQAQTPSGDVLVNNTGLMTIQDNAVDGTDIAITSEANGSMMYFNGTDWVNLGAGAANEVLTINGSGIPQWTNAAAALTKKDIVAGAGNNAVSITNGAAQVIGATNVTVNVATNALNQAGVVTGTTAANSLQVWGTTAAGVPGWVSPNLLVKAQNGLNINTTAPNASAANPYLELGGTLVRNTTITQDNFNYLQNLSGTGAFEVRSGATAGAGLYVAAANNVGIGTASPSASAKLQVSATDKGILIPNVALTASNVAAPVTSPATSLLVYNTATAGASTNSVFPGFYYWNGTSWQRFDTGNNMGDWKLDGNNNGALRSIGTNDNFDFPIETNGTERMRVTTGGNVGIGTSTPAAKLHIVDNTIPSAIIQSSSNVGTWLSMGNTDPNGKWFSLISTATSNGEGAGKLIFTRNAAANSTAGTIMTLEHATSYVGIGTTTPRGIFDVAPNSDIYLVNSPIAGTAQSIFLPGHIYIAPFSGSNVSYLQARRSDNSGTTSLRIRTYNAGALTEAMHIEGNGNVGVGTTAPDAKAIVDMTATTKGVLFPRMTTAQRDAISGTIPEGLHLYNISNDCLEFFDTKSDPPGGPTGGFWNSYCHWCENTYAYNANSNANDFNAQVGYPTKAQKWCVWINAGVTLGANTQSGIALNFSGLPGGSEVVVYNYGTVVGGGGNAGGGGQESDGVCAGDNGGGTGAAGGTAIFTSAAVQVQVFNYNIVAGGGGGGGGGSGGCRSAGGGGGGGRGIPGGIGGGGWTTSSGWKACGGICTSCCGSPGSSGGFGGSSGAAGTGNCSYGNSGGGCFYSGYNGGCGGNGGNWGTAGGGGGGGNCGSAPAGGGGAAGFALRGSGGGSSITNYGGTYYGPVQP